MLNMNQIEVYNMLEINEIYKARNGEGLDTGVLSVIVRFSQCNLNCWWCDTKYITKEKPKRYAPKKLFNKIKKYKCKTIMLTGGEPLIQNKYELASFVKLLLDNGYRINLETNGSIKLPPWTTDKNVLVSMDIKCPSSKMQKFMHWDNIIYLTYKDQLKFVIKDKKDLRFAKKIIKKFKPKTNIIFQPVWVNPKETQWLFKETMNMDNIRIMLQQHKIVYGIKKRRV